MAGQLQAGPVNSTAVYASGHLHNIFGSGEQDGPTDYKRVEIRNTSAVTVTSPVVWLTLDTGGAAVDIAVADAGTARPGDYFYNVDPTGLTYSAPTTEASGLALPTLAAGQKCLIAIRRTLAGASPDYPDNNILNCWGTSPA